MIISDILRVRDYLIFYLFFFLNANYNDNAMCVSTPLIDIDIKKTSGEKEDRKTVSIEQNALE